MQRRRWVLFLNYAGSDDNLIARFEKALSPIRCRLGLGKVIDLEELLNSANFKIDFKDRVNIFKLCQIIKCKNNGAKWKGIDLWEVVGNSNSSYEGIWERRQITFRYNLHQPGFLELFGRPHILSNSFNPFTDFHVSWGVHLCIILQLEVAPVCKPQVVIFLLTGTTHSCTTPLEVESSAAITLYRLICSRKRPEWR